MKKQSRNRVGSLVKMLPPHSVNPFAGKPPVNETRDVEPGLPPIAPGGTPERFTHSLHRERVVVR